MIPDAALAVLAAAYTESQQRGEDAHRYRQRAERDLRRAGWDVVPTGTTAGRQAGTQHAA